jgi:hypothetical protein
MHLAGGPIKYLNCLQLGVSRTVLPSAKNGAGIPDPGLLAALPSGPVILRFVPAPDDDSGLPNTCTPVTADP